MPNGKATAVATTAIRSDRRIAIHSSGERSSNRHPLGLVQDQDEAMALGPHERTPTFDELCFHEATAPEASFRAGRARLRRAAGRDRYIRAFHGKVESGSGVDRPARLRESTVGGNRDE